MTRSENESTTSLERKLLWLGYEDYTGLWQVVIEVKDEVDTYSMRQAQGHARGVIESLLSRGWIDIYATEGPWNNETIAVVPQEERISVLNTDESWSSPGGGKKLVWFATTDEGYFAYQRASDGRNR